MVYSRIQHLISICCYNTSSSRISNRACSKRRTHSGAENIPWAQTVNDKDGTFKSADELKKLYESKGITPDKEIIAYCRIGERSSHTWFVLKYLLGYPDVK